MSDEIDVEILEMFLSDARKIAKALEEALRSLGANSSDPDRIQALVRLAHSLKGAASSVQTAEDFPSLAPLAAMAQAWEACFNAAKAGRVALNAADNGVFLEAASFVARLGASDASNLKASLLEAAATCESFASRFAAIESGGRSSAATPELNAALAASCQIPTSPPPDVKGGSIQKELAELPMLALFKAEAETQAKALNDGLMKLEADPESSGETLIELMRAAHSMKGAARIILLDELVALAHSMESCFVAAKDGLLRLEGDHFDALLAGADLVERLSKEPDSGMASFVEANAGRFRELAAAYEAIKGGVSP